jgi:hypothetical protein
MGFSFEYTHRTDPGRPTGALVLSLKLELLDGGAELAQGYAQRHSRKYLHLHHKFIFITSIFIGFIAIVIQYVLESESGKPLSNTGFMRPGWARHRSDGWQHQHGR